MAKNIGIDKIKDKRETLVEQFNSLQDKKKELLRQIELVDTDSGVTFEIALPIR